MQEIWKDITDYEELYQVSNLGRVKTLKREIIRSKPYLSKRIAPEKIIYIKPLNDYLGVTLYKDGKRKSFLVHRLVAKAFIPNPNNLPQVNHKDENKYNNCVSNLEWCTNDYNLNYGTGRERFLSLIMKPVCKFSLDGVFLEKYSSQTEAAIKNGVSQANISKCCNGKTKNL